MHADACQLSPARLPAGITVAASDKTDTRWPNSNYGSCVDLYAPGVAVLSAMHTSDTATMTASGTSMSCPHVSGVAALYLQSNPTAQPNEVSTYMATPFCVFPLCCTPQANAWYVCCFAAAQLPYLHHYTHSYDHCYSFAQLSPTLSAQHNSTSHAPCGYPPKASAMFSHSNMMASQPLPCAGVQHHH